MYLFINIIIRVFVVIIFGWLSCQLVKKCQNEINCGLVSYKIPRGAIFLLCLFFFIFYNAISFIEGDAITSQLEEHVVYMMFLGIVALCLPLCNSKLAPWCCGRRRCCFKRQTKKTLIEVLTDIDINIPSAADVSVFKQRGERYLLRFHEELEKEFLGQSINILFTGSGAERFGLPLSSEWYSTKTDIENEHALLSDFDFMFYLQNLKASQNTNSHFIIISNSLNPRIQPGYALLMITEKGKNILSLSRGTFLYAKLIKERVYQALSSTKLNIYPDAMENGDTIPKLKIISLEVVKKGPAVKIKIGRPMGCLQSCALVNLNNTMFLADLTFSIKSEWPRCVDWSARDNRIWPAIEDIQRIESHGCHLVPKSQLNDHEELTWRFSFSKAEVELSKLVNPIARKCFLALKVITKDHLQPIAKWFTSYHIKTILFHTLEITPLDMWVEENLKNCFDLLSKELIKSLDKRMCKHFWISSINLFDIVGVTCIDIFNLLCKTESIMKNPEWFIEDWNFNWDENSLRNASVAQELEIINEETRFRYTEGNDSYDNTSEDSNLNVRLL